jgi:hypothetical protein
MIYVPDRAHIHMRLGSLKFLFRHSGSPQIDTG